MLHDMTEPGAHEAREQRPPRRTPEPRHEAAVKEGRRQQERKDANNRRETVAGEDEGTEAEGTHDGSGSRRGRLKPGWCETQLKRGLSGRLMWRGRPPQSATRPSNIRV